MKPLHETVRVSREFGQPLPVVWKAFADTGSRARWSVPEGEELVYDVDDLRSGGLARYRCGDPGVLQFAAEMEYVQVVPEECVVHTDTVRTDGTLLSTALVTWIFAPTPTGTEISIVDQVVSFAGPGMIDGHRNGHAKALAQLAAFLG